MLATTATSRSLLGTCIPPGQSLLSLVPNKGPDPYATRRLASFFRACGMASFTYMSDQEGAVRTMLLEAIQVTKGRGEWVGAVPENSPVGESQSNGRAERSVQQLEDQVRTLLGELEDRIKQQLKPDAPVVSWLVEYAAVLLNKYHVHEDTGQTAYENLHGHPSEERLAYFGERLYFHVPKRRRSNLDLRWAEGIFLGTLMTSTEALMVCPMVTSHGPTQLPGSCQANVGDVMLFLASKVSLLTQPQVRMTA